MSVQSHTPTLKLVFVSIPKGAIMRLGNEFYTHLSWVSIPKGAIMSQRRWRNCRRTRVSIPKGAIMRKGGQPRDADSRTCFNSKRCDYEINYYYNREMYIISFNSKRCDYE